MFFIMIVYVRRFLLLLLFLLLLFLLLLHLLWGDFFSIFTGGTSSPSSLGGLLLHLHLQGVPLVNWADTRIGGSDGLASQI